MNGLATRRNRTCRRLFPFLSWSRDSSATTMKADFIAGLTGAVVILPQGVPFATIAGLRSLYRYDSGHRCGSIRVFPPSGHLFSNYQLRRPRRGRYPREGDLYMVSVKYGLRVSLGRWGCSEIIGSDNFFYSKSIAVRGLSANWTAIFARHAK